MKGVFSAPGDYVYFKSQVLLHKIPVLMSRLMILYLTDTSLWYIPGRLPHINFCSASPRRVKSLMLSNIFLETQSFATAMPWAPVVSRTPSCLQKRYVLTGIRDGPPHEPFMADSVDFVVSQI
ncbi:uncharacterized protein LOC119986573 isoform X2 [Tripterygium wilfordii]|uniref:uncharacterized protein LOC119986573 isoform X2 n=1 Tax=Tripterygium wilfordii TaxID=458696 RepID=UPI0018F80460|nr:uncharacterized protein LOC119986573 isoform X2 [Tripterygium wilfordii]